MTWSRGLLLTLLIVELAVAGVLIGRPTGSAPPKGTLVPADDHLGPLVGEQLRELRRRADAGGAEDWRTFAEGLLGQGLYASAEHAFREAVRLDPRDVDAAFGLAFALDRMGRFEESLAEWRATAELADRPGMRDRRQRANYMIGMTHLRLERADEAETAFLGNLGHPASEYQLAKLHVRADRLAEALPIIERNLEALPDSLAFNGLHHRSLTAAGRSEEALVAEDALELAQHRFPIALGTDYVRPFRGRLGTERLKQDYNAVVGDQNPDELARQLDAMDAAIGGRNVPEAAANAMSRAEVAFLRRDWAALERALDARRSLSVVSSDALVLRAVHLAETGTADEAAVEMWRRVLDLAPNAIAFRALAAHYDRESKPVERDRNLARLKLLQGLIHIRSGRPIEGIDRLEASVDANGNDPRGWFHLGEARRRLGDIDGARDAFERCLELTPNNGRARRRLSQLTP